MNGPPDRRDALGPTRWCATAVESAEVDSGRVYALCWRPVSRSKRAGREFGTVRAKGRGGCERKPVTTNWAEYAKDVEGGRGSVSGVGIPAQNTR